jgi:hypothetical protein
MKVPNFGPSRMTFVGTDVIREGPKNSFKKVGKGYNMCYSKITLAKGFFLPMLTFTLERRKRKKMDTTVQMMKELTEAKGVSGFENEVRAKM